MAAVADDVGKTPWSNHSHLLHFATTEFEQAIGNGVPRLFVRFDFACCQQAWAIHPNTSLTFYEGIAWEEKTKTRSRRSKEK